MGAGHEFDFKGVYLKGAYFIHALRNKIGDAGFFTAMRGIQREHAGGNLSMNGLRDLLEDDRCRPDELLARVGAADPSAIAREPVPGDL